MIANYTLAIYMIHVSRAKFMMRCFAAQTKVNDVVTRLK